MTKLKHSNYDNTQKLKFRQNSETQMVTKLKHLNCEKIQTQIVTKLKNTHCDQTQKIKL